MYVSWFFTDTFYQNAFSLVLVWLWFLLLGFFVWLLFFFFVFFFLTEVQNKTWEMDTIKLFQASSSAGHLNFAILATVI